MFLLYGGSSSTVIRHRVIIAGLLIFLLYMYWNHNSELDILKSRYASRLQSCQNNAESLVTQLRVLFDHKQIMESIYNINKNKSAEIIIALRNKIFTCELNLLSMNGQLTICEDNARNASSTGQISFGEGNKTEVDRLNEVIGQLEGVSRRKEQSLDKALIEIKSLKTDLYECYKNLEQYVGAVPIAHYTQNDTASFRRMHKSDDALSFDRGDLHFEQAPLLPSKQLIEKIKRRGERSNKSKKKEELDRYIDDRRKEDVYVNELPDANEKDYKEGP